MAVAGAGKPAWVFTAKEEKYGKPASMVMAVARVIVEHIYSAPETKVTTSTAEMLLQEFEAKVQTVLENRRVDRFSSPAEFLKNRVSAAVAEELAAVYFPPPTRATAETKEDRTIHELVAERMRKSRTAFTYFFESAFQA